MTVNYNTSVPSSRKHSKENFKSTGDIASPGSRPFCIAVTINVFAFSLLLLTVMITEICPLSSLNHVTVDTLWFFWNADNGGALKCALRDIAKSHVKLKSITRVTMEYCHEQDCVFIFIQSVPGVLVSTECCSVVTSKNVFMYIQSVPRLHDTECFSFATSKTMFNFIQGVPGWPCI